MAKKLLNLWKLALVETPHLDWSDVALDATSANPPSKPPLRIRTVVACPLMHIPELSFG